MRKIFALILLIVLSSACSGIKLLSQEDSYSDAFLKKIENVQNIYRDGLSSEALAKLQQINDQDITDVERAKKYNFIGIIQYSSDNLADALKSFEKANGFKHNNQLLLNQIILNLSSSYYRMDKFDYSNNFIKQINSEVFSPSEKEKYNTLKLSLGRKFDNHKYIVESTFALGSGLKDFSDVESYNYLSILKSSFSKLAESEKIYYLEKNSTNMLAAYLAKEEAFNKISVGDKSSINNIIEWLDDNFSHVPEIAKIIDDYESNLEHYTKIDSRAIGVILPLSGKMKKFGNKALRGIEAAISHTNNKERVSTLFSRDSKHNSAVAAKAVRELVEKHKVSVIIGGLFSSTAEAQYLECRKYGVLFISLAAVNLAKEQKNHLLVEIPGSIQSQIHDLTQASFLEKFGKRVAIFYPKNKKGQIYVDELWRLHENGLINITAINHYEDGLKDFRDPISKLLGLKFKREREEELKVWKKIYAAQSKNSAIRRKQYLKPVIDFDWIFVPALPKDAVQILPTFNWFDAKRVNYVGIPSWNARKLVKSRQRYGKIFFIGDDNKDYDLSFTAEYKKRNQSAAKLVEIFSFEAMNLALGVTHSLNFSSREEFSGAFRSMAKLKGITGNWSLVANQWLKQMDYLQIKGRSVSKVEFEAL